MQFKVQPSYNLDLLNLVNILTQDPMYLDQHPGIYQSLGEKLSSHSKACIGEMVELNGGAMLGPLFSLVLSAVPNFGRRSIVRVFSDPDFMQACLQRFPYYDEAIWNEKLPVFPLLIPVVRELEANGFRAYWQQERLPAIKKMQYRFRTYANRFQLDDEIELMLGEGQAPGSMTVYLCSFAAPHGIKLCGPRYITDIAFSQETSLGIAVHEMFHPPYDARSIEPELQRLGSDPLLQKAFAEKDPKYGYPTMTGFIEENVVEAMAIFICYKIGLEKDPMGYFSRHDGGSHKLSVVLFDAFSRHPKSRTQSFQDYFLELLQQLPVGSLDQLGSRPVGKQTRSRHCKVIQIP